jgi:hypothetical protein
MRAQKQNSKWQIKGSWRKALKPLVLVVFLLPGLAQAGFNLRLGGHFGYGKMGNDTTDENRLRNMGTFDLQGMPTLSLFNQILAAGLILDYRFLSQFSDDTTLTQYNGHGYLFGPVAALNLPLITALFAWDILARHSYSGPDTTYKGSGFHFLIGYKIVSNISLDLEYVIANYNAVKINDVETGLGEHPVSHKNLGLGLSWTY